MSDFVLVRNRKTIDADTGKPTVVVEFVDKNKFDFTNFVFLRHNNETNFDEYVHKDEYEVYRKLVKLDLNFNY